MGPGYGPLPSLGGSEVWAPCFGRGLVMVVSWVHKDSELGARTRGEQDLLWVSGSASASFGPKS